MSETYVCDECDKRIRSGYTVCWSKTLEDSPAGVHFSGSPKVRNLCRECFPDEKKPLTTRIWEMLVSGK